MHVLIDDFRRSAEATRRAKRRRSFARAMSWLAVLSLVAAVGVAGWQGALPWGDDDTGETLAIPAGERQDSEQDFQLEATDKMRNPVFLQTAAESGAKENNYEIRFQNPGAATPSGKIHYVADRMMNPSVQLITALPASPQDFALMGSASVAERTAPPGDESVLATVPDVEATPDDGGAGWAEETLPGESGQALPALPPSAGETVGSSSLVVIVPGQRVPAAREFIIRVLFQRSIENALREGGVKEQQSLAAAQAAARLLNLAILQPGYIAAFRVDNRPQGSQLERTVVQLSILTEHGAAGAIGLDANGDYVRIDDPWASEGLLAYAENKLPEGAETSRVRIMDGLYAAGVRNGVPPNVLSEVIVQMARGYDLSTFIQSSDRFTVIYSDAPRDATRSDGHVLYASVISGGKTLACYVLKPGRDEGFTCMTEKDTVTQKLGPTGFVTPVSGVLRSGFGPRMHPILRRVRTHQGVDWAAPSGTPIVAVFQGTINFAGPNGGYGNFVRIAHPNGLASGYAHMSAFAKGIAPGVSVKAGDVIGYVGTTGLSTGPHLHFELYVDGEAVDPFSFDAPTADAGANEKDKLIARIISVESGGDAGAKNPLSSASGLGQFISGTWMRMIRSYRPDLASSMNESDILALRFEPTIAREMLYHFAAENEADLKRAGLQATAGNLYLAHFLGSGGAVAVLRSAPDEPLENVVGYDVIAANRFLTGHDAGWIIDWSARKMTGRGVTMVRRLPPEARIKNSRFAAYSEAIDNMLRAIEANRPAI